VSPDLSAVCTLCVPMIEALRDPDVPLVYIAHYREFGLIYQDGGTSTLLITHCPWCGQLLPSSLRERWFAEIDELGLEPDDPAVPSEYASDQWWRS